MQNKVVHNDELSWGMKVLGFMLIAFVGGYILCSDPNAKYVGMPDSYTTFSMGILLLLAGLWPAGSIIYDQLFLRE